MTAPGITSTTRSAACEIVVSGAVDFFSVLVRGFGRLACRCAVGGAERWVAVIGDAAAAAAIACAWRARVAAVRVRTLGRGLVPVRGRLVVRGAAASVVVGRRLLALRTGAAGTVVAGAVVVAFGRVAFPCGALVTGALPFGFGTAGAGWVTTGTAGTGTVAVSCFLACPGA